MDTMTYQPKVMNADVHEDNACEALDLLLDPIKLRRVLSMHDFLDDDSTFSHTFDSLGSLQSDSSFSWSSSSEDPCYNPMPLLELNAMAADFMFAPRSASLLLSAGCEDKFEPPVEERVCYACKKCKPVTMFCKNQRRRKGSKARCMLCVAASVE